MLGIVWQLSGRPPMQPGDLLPWGVLLLILSLRVSMPLRPKARVVKDEDPPVPAARPLRGEDLNLIIKGHLRRGAAATVEVSPFNKPGFTHKLVVRASTGDRLVTTYYNDAAMEHVNVFDKSI